MKANFQLSRGEICVENVIPPANGASLGSFLCSRRHSQTDRQTDNSLGVCRFFLQVKFVTSILALLAGDNSF